MKKRVDTSCKLCFAPVVRTEGGKKIKSTCRRLSSCKSGCNQFCWQHAQEYTREQVEKKGEVYHKPEKGRCTQPVMRGCHIVPRKFPCRVGELNRHEGLGIFFNEKEYKKYDKIVTDQEPVTEEMLKKAAAEFKREKKAAKDIKKTQKLYFADEARSRPKSSRSEPSRSVLKKPGKPSKEAPKKKLRFADEQLSPKKASSSKAQLRGILKKRD